MSRHGEGGRLGAAAGGALGGDDALYGGEEFCAGRGLDAADVDAERGGVAMMFSMCPAWREPTLRTEMSEGLISRLMMVWRRTTTWAARRAGSIVRWGWGCQFWFFFFLFGGEENSPEIHAHQPQTA